MRILTEDQKASRKAYKAEWHQANKERLNAKSALWRKNNPERVRELWDLWEKENPEKTKESNALWAKANPEKQAQLQLDWARKNKARVNAKSSKWRKQNPEKMNAFVAQRKALKLKATPEWADPKQINAMYKTAADRTKETGEQHHVDHIVPLRSPLVCGLHVPSNLRVILGAENCSKGNRHWEGMP